MACEQEAAKRGRSLSEARAKVQGEADLLLLSRLLKQMDLGGRLWVCQLTDGFPGVGELGEPEVFPVDAKCKTPDPVPE